MFNLSGTSLLGQHANRIVADGEIERDGKWLLWDNKRRRQQLTLGSSTQSKIKNYIDTKSQQHTVEWFLIIAPDFAETARTNANKLEMQVRGVDIRLVQAVDFVRLAELWREGYAAADRELPLSVFCGSDLVDFEIAEKALQREFS